MLSTDEAEPKGFDLYLNYELTDNAAEITNQNCRDVISSSSVHRLS